MAAREVVMETKPGHPCYMRSINNKAILEGSIGRGEPMIVECPVCHTRYRIESAEVLDDSTFFECSQAGCRCVFPYSPPPLKGGGKAVPPPRPPGAEALGSADKRG